MDETGRILIFGAGALGSLLGGKLSLAGPVVLIARGAHLQAMRRNGLRLAGQSRETLRGPRLVFAESLAEVDPPLSASRGDTVLLTVKAGQVEEAGAALASHVNGSGSPGGGARIPLITLQNGTGFEEPLRAAAGEAFDIQHAVAHVGATLVEPGLVENWGGELLLPDTPAAHALHERLVAGGVDARTLPALEMWRWKKIAFNCALNALSAILDVRNKETIRDEWKALRLGVLDEVRVAAAARGVTLPDTETLCDEFEGRASRSNNVNSMLQDLQRGRPTELPFLNGAIVREAERAGRDVPWNGRLVDWMTRLAKAARDPDTGAAQDIRRQALAALRERAA